jgi:hypothetical protein
MSKRIALIVHNYIYPNPKLARLKPPVADTAALAALLRNPAIGKFDRVELAINQSAHELLRRVTDLFRHKQRHDDLLLYFIGLVLVDEIGQWYLAAPDTRLDAPAETALAAAHLTNLMDRSFSRRQILLLDCLYFYATPPAGDSLNGLSATTFKGRGYGRGVLTSTQDRVAAGGETIETSFTHYLLQGLQTAAADLNNDGEIEWSELVEYIQRQINPLQLSLRSYGELDNLILAHNPQQFGPAQIIKWDLISGAILAPATIIVIGGNSDLRASIGLAGLFLLLYALLYLAPD